MARRPAAPPAAALSPVAAGVPATPPGFTPHDPNAPNAIAALALSHTGEPVVPHAAVIPKIASTIVNFRTSQADAGSERACAVAALAAGQAALATAGSAATEPASPPCTADGTISGRMRLSVLPAAIGKERTPAFQCEVTIRYGADAVGGQREARGTNLASAAAAACEAAGDAAITDFTSAK